MHVVVQSHGRNPIAKKATGDQAGAAKLSAGQCPIDDAKRHGIGLPGALIQH
jgi:hypothetical protein